MNKGEPSPGCCQQASYGSVHNMEKKTKLPWEPGTVVHTPALPALGGKGRRIVAPAQPGFDSETLVPMKRKKEKYPEFFLIPTTQVEIS